MPVSEDSVIWAYRMFLGRDPESPDVVNTHATAHEDLDALRQSFMRLHKAKELFREANGWDEEQKRYQLPLFLLRRPASPDVSWRFEEPSLVNPVTQLCTSEQMAAPEYRELCTKLGLDHTKPQRKIWEFAYVLAALQGKGMFAPGRRGLGFGTGHEPLPSAFANVGAQILATDAPPELESRQRWAARNQWTKELDDLWKPELVGKEEFLLHVSHRPVDMNAIPADLRGFDFCWSACALEHLGSVRLGLDFIRNSMDTLKPGGIAVHTTEFNLQSDDDTLEVRGLCVPRKRDIEQVIHELEADGHHVEPLNLWPGSSPVDEHIDLPPFSSPHLKLFLQGVVTTSIGITITKKA